jgi:hypothetical protein
MWVCPVCGQTKPLEGGFVRINGQAGSRQQARARTPAQLASAGVIATPTFVRLQRKQRPARPPRVCALAAGLSVAPTAMAGGSVGERALGDGL